MEKRKILSASALFAHFHEPELALLAENTEVRDYDKGEFVIQEKENSLDLFFIERGRARIERSTPYGPYTLAVLSAGDLFGETSFIDGDTRSGGAKVLEPTRIMSLSSETVLNLIKTNKSFELAMQWSFWKSLSQKLRSTNERLKFFFSIGAAAPIDSPKPRRDPTGSFHIDMKSKRDLFREMRLSNMEINFLSSLSKEKEFDKGDVIFREGDPGNHMYIVLDGRIMISKFVPGAGEEALAFLGRGDFFGEMALIDGKPRSAFAKAHDGGAVVLAIPAGVVEGILDINKISSIRLLRILCTLVAHRLRELDDKIVGWFILSGGSLPSADD